MKMKYRRTWMILTAALVLILLGGGGYWHFTRGKQVVAPANTQENVDHLSPDLSADDGESEEARAGVVDIEYVRLMHPKVKVLNQLDDRIKDYQSQLNRKNTELAATRQQVTEQYSGLDLLFNNQVKEIQTRYQQQIDAKTEALQRELTSFEESAMKDATAGVQRKQEDLQKKGKEQIERYQAKQMEELAGIEHDLNAQYSPRILNLQLKLQMVRLSEAEQKEYRSELEKLEAEQQQKLQDERAKFDTAIKAYIQAKQTELDQELQVFQNQTKQNIEKALKGKQAELDTALKAYIAEMEAAMQAEITGKQSRIAEQKKNGLDRAQQQIQSEITKNDQLLSAKIADARKRQTETWKEIDQEIEDAVSEVARENNVDVILTDFKVNAKAVDLTDLVIEKLRQ